MHDNIQLKFYKLIIQEFWAGPSFILNSMFKYFSCTVITILFFCRPLIIITDYLSITNFELHTSGLASPHQALWFLLFGLCLDLIIRPLNFHRKESFKNIILLHPLALIFFVVTGSFCTFFILNHLSICSWFVDVPHKIYFFTAYSICIYLSFAYEAVRSKIDVTYRTLKVPRILEILPWGAIYLGLVFLLMMAITMNDIWIHMVQEYNTVGIFYILMPSQIWIFFLSLFLPHHIINSRIIR